MIVIPISAHYENIIPFPGQFAENETNEVRFREIP